MRRILLLNYEYPPLGGGAGNATKYILQEFSDRSNIEIDVITSSSNLFRMEQFSKNIRIFFLDIGKKGKSFHFQSQKDLLMYSWKAFWFARGLIKKNHYDLVHAFFGIPCGYIAMKLGLRYMVSLRGSDVPFYSRRFKKLDKFLFQHMSRAIWKKAEHVVANSKGLQQLALQTATQKSIRVITNGVDINKFQAIRRKKQEKFTVLYVGRLIERKGVDILINAFAKLFRESDKVQLYIVGDGNLKKQLQQQVKNLGISDSTYFLGRVDHDKLPSLYRTSDVYVLPSANEGMSNTLLEAIAAGLPVITTATGGTMELVQGNGFILKTRTVKEIYQALKKIKKNDLLRAEFSRQSSKIAKKMSWKKVADEYWTLYNIC